MTRVSNLGIFFCRLAVGCAGVPMADMVKLDSFCHPSFALGALLVEETSQLVTNSLALRLDIAKEINGLANLDGLRLDIL